MSNTALLLIFIWSSMWIKRLNGFEQCCYLLTSQKWRINLAPKHTWPPMWLTAIVMISLHASSGKTNSYICCVDKHNINIFYHRSFCGLLILVDYWLNWLNCMEAECWDLWDLISYFLLGTYYSTWSLIGWNAIML